MTIELDTCGLLCPLPVLKARKRLIQMESGETLRVTADDPLQGWISRISAPSRVTNSWRRTMVRTAN